MSKTGVQERERAVLAQRLPADRRRATRPHGLVSGQRTGIRRLMSRASAAINRALDWLPLGRLLHAHVRHLDFTEVTVEVTRGDRGLDGLRIAFLSDLHAGSFMNEDELCAIFESVNEHAPDLVCLGGDLINTRECEILYYRRALQCIDPPLGVFAVPGNHDYFWGRDIGLWEAFLSEYGVQVLNNRGVRIERDGATLWIAGVDDLTEGTPDLATALFGVGANEPIVLLAHHPDFFFEAAAVDVDLTLSGHTHGGQVAFKGWAPLNHSRFDYLAGMFTVERSTLYVGRGVGVTLLPVRFGARAEIPIVTLRSVAADR